MKKILLTTGLAGIVLLNANAQTQPPNGDFESWHVEGSGLDPDDWGSRNQQSTLGYPVLITRTTDKYSGTYALKLTSDSATVQPPAGSGNLDTISGIIWLNGVFIGGPPSGGIAFTSRPDSMRGFVKCYPVSGDKCHIHAKLTKQDTLVGEAIFITFDVINSYTEFVEPFVYSSQDIPDKLEIKILAGNLDQTPNRSNEFYVDDLGFIYNTTGVIETPSQIPGTFQLYPNPVRTDEFNIVNSFHQNAKFEIYDIFGRQIKSIELTGNITKISTAGLPEGMYIYQIVNDKRILKTGKLTLY